MTIGVPIAPHATGAVLASRFSTAAWNGEKPRPTMTAPAMATGVPKPDVPSMIAPNENAIRMHLDAPVERDVGDRLLDDLELPGDDA